jgi:hypothetical protein
VLHSYPSPSPRKRMESEVKSSDLVARVTRFFALFMLSRDGLHIFARIVLHQTHLWQPISLLQLSLSSSQQTSPTRSAAQLPWSAPRWGSYLLTSPPAPCAPQVQWPYYVLKSTRTSSVCSVVGVATKCSAIFTYKPSLLCGISPAACSPEARSHSCPTKKFRSDNFIPNFPQACFTPGSLPPVLLAGFPYKATWFHFPILLTIGKQVEWHVPL